MFCQWIGIMFCSYNTYVCNEKIIDTKIFTYPIISVSQIAFANLYNNRINIVNYGTIISIPLIGYLATLY